jgi:hypothetical protein
VNVCKVSSSHRQVPGARDARALPLRRGLRGRRRPDRPPAHKGRLVAPRRSPLSPIYKKPFLIRSCNGSLPRRGPVAMRGGPVARLRPGAGTPAQRSRETATARSVSAVSVLRQDTLAALRVPVWRPAQNARLPVPLQGRAARARGRGGRGALPRCSAAAMLRCCDAAMLRCCDAAPARFLRRARHDASV